MTVSRRLRIGLSISDPPEEELVALGLGAIHVQSAFVEIARHLLAAGYDLAYGGDMRPGGFTDALFDLVRTYEQRDFRGAERITSYLAWPLWEDLSVGDRAELANITRIVAVPAPNGPKWASPVPRTRLARACALGEMRERMNVEIDARVVVGGRMSHQTGLLPGVIEETDLAIAANKPTFILAGFGGAGRVAYEAVRGLRPPELTSDFQAAADPDYEELVVELARLGKPDRIEHAAQRLEQAGIEGLGTELDAGEQGLLELAVDSDEIVALILIGLRRVASKSGPA